MGTFDVVIVGGFGHVGLPLAIALARKGKRVCALDIDRKAGELIARGEMPFVEEGGTQALQEALASGNLTLSYDGASVSSADTVIIVVGTPVDRHLNPEFAGMFQVMGSYLPHLRDGQLIILRSTVYPGTTEKLNEWLRQHGKNVDVAFCPERIAEGRALKELETLPQIVAGFSEAGIQRATALFRLLVDDIIVLEPIEAELAKLFTNVWRYVTFAAANQFLMIANDHGADFYKIYNAITYKYDRAKGFSRPGLAAGPCLFKDALQLAAFNNNAFYLGHAAMLVNEGLPNYLVTRLKQRYRLRDMVAGVLGMAYKADSDDRRESLSYKLRKMLALECRDVLCSDVYIKEKGFVEAEELVRMADVVILGAPHREYATLRIPEGKEVVDIWNMWGNGCIV